MGCNQSKRRRNSPENAKYIKMYDDLVSYNLVNLDRITRLSDNSSQAQHEISVLESTVKTQSTNFTQLNTKYLTKQREAQQNASKIKKLGP